MNGRKIDQRKPLQLIVQWYHARRKHTDHSNLQRGIIQCKRKTTSQLSLMSRTKSNEELKEGSLGGSSVVSCKNNNNGPIKASTKYPVPTKRKISKGVNCTKHHQCNTLGLNLYF